MSSYARGTLLESFTALWASNDIFSSVPLNDMLMGISTDSEWDDDRNLWVHTYTIEYKPESPVDHVVFGSAANELIGALSGGLPYCGCRPIVTIDDARYGYVVHTC
jgi:hypothetical protein